MEEDAARFFHRGLLLTVRDRLTYSKYVTDVEAVNFRSHLSPEVPFQYVCNNLIIS